MNTWIGIFITSNSAFALLNAARAADKEESSTRAEDTVSSPGKMPFVEKSIRVFPRGPELSELAILARRKRWENVSYVMAD